MAEAVVRLRVDASGANRALSGVQNRTNALQKSFGGLRTAIGGIGITLLARQAVTTSANFDKLNVRLKLLTKASGSFAKSQQIAADAQKAFGLSATEALEGVTDITARLAPLGSSVEDIRTVFFGFNTAAKLAGASAIESSNAFRQLAQALGSGRLAGDEFRSISEQVPTVLAPIAEELGVTIGQLKQLAADGKLTSDVVLRALGRIGNEGSGFLQELLKNDPTQVFKNFTNATEDLSRAFGTQLRPAIEAVTKSLTELTIKASEFINSPIGQTAFIFAGIAFAAKGVLIALPLISAGLIKVAAAGGVATIALNAIPFVAIATAIGGVVTQLIKQKREQDAVTEAIKKGEKAQLKALEADIGIKMAKELAKINNTNDKRTIAAAERRLALLREQMIPIKERLDEVIKENAELEKANKLKQEAIDKDKKLKEEADKLKQKYMEIGKSIEDGIVQNLTDAVMGTKTLAQAAISVLNDLKRKLIEVAMQQAVSGIGNFLGNALGGIFAGGFGGSGGGLNSQALGRAASRQTGIPMNLPKGSFNITPRANGGPVSAGGSYMVGERGPELFTPRTSGTITANEKLGGSTVNNMITVNVDASGSTVEGNEGQANSFGQALGAAIQAELIAQKRAGGLLSNA